MISQGVLFWFVYACVYLCAYQKWTATFLCPQISFVLFFLLLYIIVSAAHLSWSSRLDSSDELPSDMTVISPAAQQDHYRVITNEPVVPVLIHKLGKLFKR